MFLCIFSACFYGFAAVFRVDCSFWSYLDYLDWLKSDNRWLWQNYYFFEQSAIRSLGFWELGFELYFVAIMCLNFLTESFDPMLNKRSRDIT